MSTSFARIMFPVMLLGLWACNPVPPGNGASMQDDDGTKHVVNGELDLRTVKQSSSASADPANMRFQQTLVQIKTEMDESILWTRFQNALAENLSSSQLQSLFELIQSHKILENKKKHATWQARWTRAAMECTDADKRQLYQHYQGNWHRRDDWAWMNEGLISPGESPTFRTLWKKASFQRSRLVLDSSGNTVRSIVVDTVRLVQSKSSWSKKLDKTFAEGLWRITLLDKPYFQEFIVTVTTLRTMARLDSNDLWIWAESYGDTSQDSITIRVGTPKGPKAFRIAEGGILRLRLQKDTLGTEMEPIQFSAQQGDLRIWSEPIWEHNSGRNAYQAAFWTDRPLYRPGQWMRFHGFLRDQDSQGLLRLTKPSPDSVRISVYESHKRDAYRVLTLAVDANGHFGDSVLLDSGFSLGQGRFMMNYLDKKSGWQWLRFYGAQFGFDVQEYRRPEFSLEVAVREPVAVVGDSIHLMIQGSYGSGASLGGIPVEILLKDQATVLNKRKIYASQSVFLDAQGTARVAIPIQDIPGTWSFRMLQLEVRARDASNREEVVTQNIPFSKFRYQLSLTAQNEMLCLGDSLTLKATLTDLNGKPRKSLLLLRAVTRDSQVPAGIVYTQETDSAGNATWRIPVVSRKHLLWTVSSTEENLVASAHEWTSVEDSEGCEEREKEIKLQIPAGPWKYGDTLPITLHFPGNGNPVLIQASGTRLGDLRQGMIRNDSFHTRIPIKRLGGQFSVVAFVGMKSGIQEKQETIEIQDSAGWARAKWTAPSSAEPGDTMTVHLDVMTRNGAPKQASLNVFLMDEALLSIGKERSDVKMLQSLLDPHTRGVPSVYYAEHPQGIFSLSLGASFNNGFSEGGSGGIGDMLGGLLGGGGGALHKRNPGAVSANFLKGVAGLQRSGTTVLGGRRGEEMPAGDLEDLVIPMRKDFLESPVWMDRVQTNAKGGVDLRIPLPGDLTQWRLVAIGTVDDSLVVYAEHSFNTRKTLMVQLETPRSLIQGDTSVIATAVRNLTDDSLNVQVEFALSGEVAQALGSKTQRVWIAGGESVALHWPVVAVKAGKLGFAARVAANIGTRIVTDGEERSIPVQPRGVVWNSGWSGIITGASPQNPQVAPLEKDDLANRTWTLEYARNPYASAIQSLDYLTGYPYGCAEQTLHRFVPNHWVAKGLRRLGKPDTALERNLPMYDSIGLMRLHHLQGTDGSWSWWGQDKGSAVLTAQVSDGISRVLLDLPESLKPIAEQSLKRSIPILYRDFTRAKWSEVERAQLAMTLARMQARLTPAQKLVVQQSVEKSAGRSNLSSESLALWLEAATAIGDTISVRKISANLRALAIPRSGEVYWKSKDSHPWWNQDAEVTAQAAIALHHANPNDLLPLKALTWLLRERDDGYWVSTRTTARVIEAVMELAEKDAINSDANLKLDAQTLSGQPIAQVLPGREGKMKLPADIDPRSIRLSLKGKGRFYYSLHLKQYLIAYNMPDKAGSAKISKTYSKDTLKPGERMEIEIKVILGNQKDYLMIEDPIPRGTEVVTMDQDLPNQHYRRGYRWFGTVHEETRDDRKVFFVTHAESDTLLFRYTLRAERQGSYQIPPVRLEPMYDPGESVFGKAGWLRIE